MEHDMTTTEMIQAAMQYGLPTVLLFAFLWATYRGFKWTGLNVLVPMKDAAIAHLTGVKEAVECQAASIDKLNDTLDAIQQDTGRRLDDIRDKITVRHEIHKIGGVK